ncbi:platelet-activating factor receptor-like [Callorhinchus milii]|uniref:platelet-activating factor receptor-like n=1 Tax=Callorhinchus milii TaxID=7868 RepID=UPI0004574855|nr:platelet-activating factor receptor-like [Callorhinchus milii]|eukprot:gi/632976110/ref/XP_007904613.1/ PREDICTED: platelet-activating factor receptor-like [Callorhinchus milii]
MNDSENETWVVEQNMTCDPWHPVQNIILPLVYLVVLFVGLLGNCVALLIFLQKARKIKKAIRVYLINLTLADILFNCLLPFWIIYYFRRGDWVLSEGACRVVGALYYLATYSAITFMILISLNRYCTVSKRKLFLTEHQGAVYTSVAIWLVWLACSIPAITEQQTSHRDPSFTKCFEDYADRSSYVYVSFAFFLLSLLIVLTSYISIIQSLSPQQNNPTKPQGAHRRRARSMVLGMLLVFLICVLPYHVSLIPWTLNKVRSTASSACGPVEPVDIVHKLNLALLSLNSCIDPIIYCFSVKRFRRELIKTMGKLLGRITFQSHITEPSESHMASNSFTSS